ncbi:heme biosynthesis HemY N-terminal domain-containing protein [Hyphococcus flavus]|uniref:Heme biosynthesis HemY N-terminal domain-containing protein n=1 Tax=Hyphococcus flavus TaxID=1866326 RepID=A0AAE9ZE54_9PROT|nr:heme biosynthesis HemY N-terminal domain-containing protein [Hyphococcus flavus]WDI32941.1 heme biosynthesis HemY N-terminal domain-containing protein [Hyphococcus flavus]
MIRILIFLLGLFFFAGAITYFASLDSRITGEAFGMRFDGPSGLIVGGIILAFLAAIYLTHKIKDIIALPAKIRAKDAASKRERGIAALTRGFEAVAVGDGNDAAHHARVARRHLDDEALTRLLRAQAAQLSGDTEAAKASFSAMLEAPESEFLGLKGLYAQAMAAGDTAAAKGYAERAFHLRPNAAWAFQSVFDLGLERGAWRETREALANARKNNLIEEDKANRARAALLTADAYALRSSNKSEALSDLETALKLAPSFAPAALLAGELHLDAGHKNKAARVVETGFTGAAHPALIKFYDRLYKDESAEKRAERLKKLAEKNPTSDEAALLRARAAMLSEDWQTAIDALEPLVSGGGSAAAYALMAKAIAGRDGEEAAKPWMEHAASAPRDPRPGADGEFHLTRDGWARLVREYMDYARLSPPPIEEAAEGLSADEVRLLLAPPVAEEPLPIDEGEAAQEIASSLGAEKEPREQEEKLSADFGSLDDEDDHIHDDEEAERAAAAARNVS